jgi:hypothetical protein
MDPGTAFGVTSLVYDVVKDFYGYYCLWKDQNDELDKVRASLLWLKSLLEAILSSLKDDHLNQTQVLMIHDSIKSCQDVTQKLKKRLNKARHECPPDTIFRKLDDQRRRALYPFQRGTIVRLVESVELYKRRLHIVISLLSL